MIRDPFAILDPFVDRLSVAFFGKEKTRPTFADCAQTIGVASFATLHQMHGNRAIVVRVPSDRTEQADGMATDRPGLGLIVRAADCQPFLIFAPAKHVVGVLHVGWRGLIAGAIPQFFKVLKGEWGIAPEETFVAVGPSLCQACAGFGDPQRELPQIHSRFITGKNVDLRGAADEQLFMLGIPRDRIERSSDCTCCQPEKYWTYRGGDREAVKAGRTNILVAALLPMIG